MIDQLTKLISPLRSRVVNMVARAVIKSIDDSTDLQGAQLEILKGEVRQVERIQNYGFTSRPKAGAEAVVLRVGGKSDHVIAIAVDDRRYRLTALADGEVALYDDTGSSIVLKANGDIQLVPHSGKVKVTGDLEASGDVKAGSHSLSTHTHSLAPPAAITVTSAVSGASATATSASSITGSTAGPS